MRRPPGLSTLRESVKSWQTWRASVPQNLVDFFITIVHSRFGRILLWDQQLLHHNTRALTHTSPLMESMASIVPEGFVSIFNPASFVYDTPLSRATSKLSAGKSRLRTSISCPTNRVKAAILENEESTCMSSTVDLEFSTSSWRYNSLSSQC